MANAVVNELYCKVADIEEELKISEEELKAVRENLKSAELKFKEAKSSVYQATKFRNGIKLKLKRAKNKASSYLSQRRGYGKKNMGNIISGFVEEDL